MIIAHKRVFTVPVLLSILFAIIYVLVSFPNHYFFRTATLDLGLYTNAIYDYAHFSLADTSPFKEQASILLSDHFDPILILVSPLSWIFKSWTLLLFQVVALLLGGAGVYMFFKERYRETSSGVFGMLVFYLHYSLFSALSFDYHSNVIAACIVPWLFVFLQRQQSLKVWLCFILILICKENMALWLFFICVAAIFLFKDKGFTKQLLLMAGVAIFYFFLITALLMPALNHEQTYVQFKYSILGSNYGEAIATIVTEPFKVLKALFVNHSGRHFGDYTKSESWIFFLLSGGVVLLLRPVWLIMLIPIFLQKYLHDNISMWGVNDQYSIEFAPVIAIGGIDIISKVKSQNIRKALSIVLLLATCGTTVRLMDRTSARVPKVNVRLYQAAHWKSDLPLTEIREMLSMIPPDAVVCAQSNIYPHVAWRDKAYMFPIIKDAQYICYLSGANTYPIKQEEFDERTENLEGNSTDWEVIFSEKGVKLLKRKI